MFDNLAVEADNLAFGRINLAITDDNLAVASHNLAFGPIILALDQKSPLLYSENELPYRQSHSIIHSPQ
mgnify:CR=1 FL=1